MKTPCTCQWRDIMIKNGNIGIKACHDPRCPVRTHDQVKPKPRKESKQVSASVTTTAPTNKPVIVVMEGLSGGCAAITNAGGVARRLSPREQDKVYEVLEQPFDGLLLTGGGDVNPARYGKKPHAKVYGVDDHRDWCEMYALEMARLRGVPVLGICRGSQIMAVESGGDLRQHISGHYGSHPVKVREGSTLLKATKDERPVVRSLHHQEVLHVAKGWQVSGYAMDGTVEAIETLDGRCLGVQFHPEMQQEKEYARNIFSWLVEESARRANLPKPQRVGATRLSQSEKGRKRSNARKATAAQASAKITYFCPFDGIRFDDRQDQLDHLVYLHSVQPDENGRIVAELTR